MTRIRRTALLPYPVEKLYALINDIERYPEFMEGCVGAQLLCVEPDTLVARLDLAKGPLRQSFTTRNHLHPPHSIRMELEAGPFSQFAGQWQLDALGDRKSGV